MSHYSGTVYQPGIVPVGPVGGLPMGGMVGGVPMTPAYGTPYMEPMGNSLMMSGVGTPYGTPHIDTYPPSLARMPSNYAPSLYEGRRATYDDVYDYDRGYGRDYLDRDYERERRYYDDDDLLYRSSSRSSRRSRRGDYYDSGRDYYYDRDRDYYDDRYRSSSRGYYPSSSSYYGSSRRSGRSRSDGMSIVTNENGGVKVLRNGQERMGDKFRRLVGMDPKGVNVVRLKRGESIATGIRR